MRPLTAFVVTPAPRGSRAGNRVTALRWAKRLRELGWRVRIEGEWRGEPADVLIALHARKSGASVARHAEQRPDDPRVVALTGTDLYGDLSEPVARRSVEAATRLVVLQPLGALQVPEAHRDRVRTIRQSALPPDGRVELAPFAVVALGHLRAVKDPLLLADAVRRLGPSSRLRAFHLGGVVEEGWAERARAAASERWTWLGERPRREALRVLAGAKLLVVTSRAEGGANVVTEAIAAGVPVLSTRIDGSLGILGADHPGLFDVGDADGLAALLGRCEGEPAFLDALRARSLALRPLVSPAAERDAWDELLGELRR